MNINQSFISQNTAILKGGGIFCFNCKNVEMSQNFISGNKVVFDKNLQRSQKGIGYTLSQGGGMYYESSDPKNKLQILDSNFLSN